MSFTTVNYRVFHHPLVLSYLDDLSLGGKISTIAENLKTIEHKACLTSVAPLCSLTTKSFRSLPMICKG